MSVGILALFLLPCSGRAKQMETNVDQASTTKQADGATQSATEATSAGATQADTQQQETVENLPEWAQTLIKGLRKENEKRRRQADEERTQAEEKRLADEKKWQELAEQRAKERDEYKPYKERYEALATAQRAALTAETAKWPAEVKALLPGDDADVQTLADAVTKARKLVEALTGKADAAKGQGQPPPPAGKAGAGAGNEAARQASVAAYYREL
jgi:hypothetical protein